MRHWYDKPMGVLLGLAPAAAAGCAPGPDGELHLLQPQLEGWQSDVHLLTRHVLWRQGDGLERLPAQFPLPGAMTGAPTYLLYLRWPAGTREPAVGKADPAAAHGFFIQLRGEHAGLAEFTGGTILIDPNGSDARAPHRITLDLRCEDGTRVRGQLSPRRDDWRVQQFETRDRPADVAALTPLADARPADKPEPERTR